MPLNNSYWRLYLNAGDGAEVVHPGGSHALSAGRMHLVPAWGSFTAYCRGNVDHIYMHFDPGEPLRDIARQEHPAAVFFQRPIALAHDPGLEDRLRRLVDVQTRAPVWYLRAQAVALAALVSGLDQLPAAARTSLENKHEEDDAILRTLRFIEDHLHQDIAIQTLAAQLEISTSYFFRVFRRRTGCTPQRYLQNRRIAVAAERLTGSSDSIEVIAEKCGFANRFHFSRIFARRKGIGPAAFRKAAGRQQAG
ncbi:MAG: helix-turn-helix transcriptional regulator [Planctomycetes bacterium]|nr:helix-turn-helix transcriptional regulator [Planctomycetota bacterium]